jgi:hypothetical protein
MKAAPDPFLKAIAPYRNGLFETTFETQGVDSLVESDVLNLSDGPSSQNCRFERKSMETII